MHPLHDYVARQLADEIKSRRVVVWYDEPGEFGPFVDEVRGGPRTGSEPVMVNVGGASARLVEYAGSMFELRAAIEPHVRADTPDPVVLYLPGCVREPRGSALMELELAGTHWKPSLHQFARAVLLRTYTLGVVDELVPLDRNVSYEDLTRVAAGNAGAEPPSILMGIFHPTTGPDELLAAWLADDVRDTAIKRKDATRELTKLVRVRLGLELPEAAPLAKLRAITLRYVLAGEFRSDLSCPPPASLDSVPGPPEGKEQVVRDLAHRLRKDFAGSMQRSRIEWKRSSVCPTRSSRPVRSARSTRFASRNARCFVTPGTSSPVAGSTRPWRWWHRESAATGSIATWGEGHSGRRPAAWRSSEARQRRFAPR
jgi:hypothetical protein